jgi:hypothetical protein
VRRQSGGVSDQMGSWKTRCSLVVLIVDRGIAGCASVAVSRFAVPLEKGCLLKAARRRRCRCKGAVTGSCHRRSK